MPEKWTGEVICKMHNERITYDELGKELGVTKGYISMILSGRRKPKGIRERMEKAVDNIVARREQKAG